MLLCTSIEPTQCEVSVAISLSFRCNWQPSGRACENFLLSTVSYCRRSGPTETPAHTHSLKSCPRSDTHSTSTSSLPRRPRPDAATTSNTPVFITIREPLGSWGHARVRAPRRNDTFVSWRLTPAMRCRLLRPLAHPIQKRVVPED